MFIRLNENPFGLNVGDCVIRAISTALNYNWFMVHDELSFLSRQMADMPSSNRVWKEYLRQKGCVEYDAQNTCPNRYKLASLYIYKNFLKQGGVNNYENYFIRISKV